MDQKDGGKGVEQFFHALDEPNATLALKLREIIRKADPGLSETIKWGMPVYEKQGLVCALRPGKSYMALQFYTSGTSLQDPDGLLEGTGQRMRHVKIHSQEAINRALFTSWIKQASHST